MAGVPILPLEFPNAINCAAFDRVQVVTNPLGGSIISWGLKPSFSAPGPYHFYVDFGRSCTDDWEVLNTLPVVDDCFFIDMCQRHFNTVIDFYYRIRLVTPNDLDEAGNCKVYLSNPQQANGLWNKSDWLIARDIIRKEILVAKKKTNQTSYGVLVKRKRYGPPSPTTLEWDTQEILNSHSSVDHGTGILGGYYRGTNFVITFEAGWSRKITQNGEVGTVNEGNGNPRSITRRGRALAYPYVERDDVFVRVDSGERFIVERVTSIAEVGGIPLVVLLDLRLSAVTDQVYRVPIEGTPSSSSSVQSSSSSSTPVACSPQAGLNEVGEW